MKKKIILLLILLIAFLPMVVSAHTLFYKDITINFKHDGCDENAEKEVTIQLFANGEKVEGQQVTLNKNTGYTYTFKDLLVFEGDSGNEINYDIKVLENGQYKLIAKKNYKYAKTNIKKWAQVQPEDIKDGHTYVLVTDNWNYENNGFSEKIYLRGDVKAKGAQILPEYNIIDGKGSYYVLDGEPIENSKWVVSKVPTDDPDYASFKDYLMFTNEGGKKLTLSGYDRGDHISYLFKYSGKSGYIEDEEALYTNKVTLTPIADTRGKFYIGSKNLYPAPNDAMQYIALSGQNQYYASPVMQTSAQFKAFEYIEAEVEVGSKVLVESTLCETNSVVLDRNTEVKRNININLDCSSCEDKKDQGVVVQLFADGVKVEDEVVTLNAKNGLEHTFTDLPVFRDNSDEKIEYEVKAYIDGDYYSIPDDSVSLKVENIKKWVQVLPEDIKAGNTYIITAYAGNNKNLYLRGNVSSKSAAIVSEYNIVNGKDVFFVLDGEPIENSKWVVSKVPTDDPDYASFKDYLMFTNEGGKKLTLSGYDRGDHIDYLFKYSGKSGYIADEEALYTNKVMIIPANDNLGRFYIASKNLYPAPDDALQYLRLNSQNQYVATSDPAKATKFIILGYTEIEATVAGEMLINPSLCEVLELANLNNPKTGNGIIIALSLLILSGATIVALKSAKRKRLN